MDNFYMLKNDTIDLKKQLLYDAKDKSFEYHCDVLNCNKSWARQKTDKTFDEIIKMMIPITFLHFVFIHRKNKLDKFMDGRKDYIETGICVNNKNEGVDYFIFIYVDFDYLNYFIKEYNLKLRN